MAFEIHPIPRQLSPLPHEVEARRIQALPDRLECLHEWNAYTPPTIRASVPTRALTSTLCETSVNEQVYGSIYIPRVSLKEFAFIRRSARIASASQSQSHPQFQHTFRNPLGTYFDSSYTPTPAQRSQIVIDCPEIAAIYCIDRKDWERERRQRRLFERDFPHYNRALRYCDAEACDNFSPEGWNQVAVSQQEYEPNAASAPRDLSPTPGFTTDESDLEPCSDTELFGYTVKPGNHGP